MNNIIDPYSNTAYKFGFGFFETMRAINKEILFFNEHLERLFSSLNYFRLPLLDSNEIFYTILQQIDEKNLDDARIRITYSLEGKNLKPKITYEIEPFQPSFKEYANITISDHKLLHNDTIRKHKTTNAFTYFYHFLKAKEIGYDEVIFIDNQKHILEGSRTNIFFIFYDEKLENISIKTPSTHCGVLPGIARQKVIGLCKELNVKISQEALPSDVFMNAQEIFLTNSLHGIVPVKLVNGRQDLLINYIQVLKQEFEKRYKITY